MGMRRHRINEGIPLRRMREFTDIASLQMWPITCLHPFFSEWPKRRRRGLAAPFFVSK